MSLLVYGTRKRIKACGTMSLARMFVPKFVCGVAFASDFASSRDSDAPLNMRNIVQKVRPNSTNSKN